MGALAAHYDDRSPHMSEDTPVTIAVLAAINAQRDIRLQQMQDTMIREVQEVGNKIDEGFRRTNGRIDKNEATIADVRENGCLRRGAQEATIDELREAIDALPMGNAGPVGPAGHVGPRGWRGPMTRIAWHSPAGVGVIAGGTGIGLAGCLMVIKEVYALIVWLSTHVRL
jgi:hypothetical protein